MRQTPVMLHVIVRYAEVPVGYRHESPFLFDLLSFSGNSYVVAVGDEK